MAEGPAAKISHPVAQAPGDASPALVGREDVRALRARRELDEALAAEYVAGVLDTQEEAEAEARLRAEPQFAALVARWQALMATEDRQDTLAAMVPEVNIDRPIGTKARPPVQERRRGSLLADVIGWLAGALAATALVLAAIALSAPPRTPLIARLAAADNRLAYEVTLFGNDLRVSRVAGKPAGKGMVHQLWLITPGAGPVSLGLLEAEPLVIPQPPAVPGLRLGISLEPLGGSAAKIPTGPMILTAGLSG